jgi:hypothetical protein
MKASFVVNNFIKICKIYRQNVLILSIVDREDMEDQLLGLRNLSKMPTPGLRSIPDLPQERLERLLLESFIIMEK